MANFVSCTNLENFQVQVRTRTHSWISDQPADKKGDGLGPKPFEHLLAALGACKVTLVTMVAANKRIPLEKVWVDMLDRWEKKDGREEYHVHVKLRLRGELSEEDLERLVAAAEACPVRKILAKGAVIDMEIEKV